MPIKKKVKNRNKNERINDVGYTGQEDDQNHYWVREVYSLDQSNNIDEEKKKKTFFQKVKSLFSVKSELKHKKKTIGIPTMTIRKCIDEEIIIPHLLNSYCPQNYINNNYTIRNHRQTNEISSISIQSITNEDDVQEATETRLHDMSERNVTEHSVKALDVIQANDKEEEATQTFLPMVEVGIQALLPEFQAAKVEEQSYVEKSLKYSVPEEIQKSEYPNNYNNITIPKNAGLCNKQTELGKISELPIPRPNELPGKISFLNCKSQIKINKSVKQVTSKSKNNTVRKKQCKQTKISIQTNEITESRSFDTKPCKNKESVHKNKHHIKNNSDRKFKKHTISQLKNTETENCNVQEPYSQDINSLNSSFKIDDDDLSSILLNEYSFRNSPARNSSSVEMKDFEMSHHLPNESFLQVETFKNHISKANIFLEGYQFNNCHPIIPSKTEDHQMCKEQVPAINSKNLAGRNYPFEPSNVKGNNCSPQESLVNERCMPSYCASESSIREPSKSDAGAQFFESRQISSNQNETMVKTPSTSNTTFVCEEKVDSSSTSLQTSKAAECDNAGIWCTNISQLNYTFPKTIQPEVANDAWSKGLTLKVQDSDSVLKQNKRKNLNNFKELITVNDQSSTSGPTEFAKSLSTECQRSSSMSENTETVESTSNNDESLDSDQIYQAQLQEFRENILRQLHNISNINYNNHQSELSPQSQSSTLYDTADNKNCDIMGTYLNISVQQFEALMNNQYITLTSNMICDSANLIPSLNEIHLSEWTGSTPCISDSENVKEEKKIYEETFPVNDRNLSCEQKALTNVQLDANNKNRNRVIKTSKSMMKRTSNHKKHNSSDSKEVSQNTSSKSTRHEDTNNSKSPPTSRAKCKQRDSKNSKSSKESSQKKTNESVQPHLGDGVHGVFSGNISRGCKRN